MRVEDVMKRDVATVAGGETFGNAFRMLKEKRIRSLPVVDADGVYRGMFDLYDVWEVLLPRAATLSSTTLRDLAFASGSVDQLREKLAAAESRPVSQFLSNKTAPAVAPEAPLQEAILLLYRADGDLPVVDRQSGKLEGTVSAWELLHAVSAG